MYQVAVLTSEPASEITLVDVVTVNTKEDAVAWLNVQAKTWITNHHAGNEDWWKLDDFSLPHNGPDPTLLDDHHTWLSANDREYEFIGAIKHL